MSREQEIRDKARELLANGTVDVVIGWETGSDGLNARPTFIYKAEEADRLVFNQTCVHNLAKYLPEKKSKRIAVVVKPCDARMVNVLLFEKQGVRDKVFIIGTTCEGVVERTTWGAQGQELQSRCKACTQHTPVTYDVLVGPEVPEPTSEIDRFALVAKMEAMSEEERADFWAAEFDKCTRCYACRQACPACYCAECVVEQIDPDYVGIRIAREEVQLFHMIRAFHLAGRCVGCSECQRVCPVNIPLGLLNAKFSKDIKEMFAFTPGLSAEQSPPLETFKKEDRLGVGE
ncbi:MAG: hypothetical protein EPO21_10220 [Chloroflexota bacterium]|nr:MAG: hypothetical protein EPO21_10220 [Chloroflexota bacterium]